MFLMKRLVDATFYANNDNPTFDADSYTTIFLENIESYKKSVVFKAFKPGIHSINRCDEGNIEMMKSMLSEVQPIRDAVSPGEKNFCYAMLQVSEICLGCNHNINDDQADIALVDEGLQQCTSGISNHDDPIEVDHIDTEPVSMCSTDADSHASTEIMNAGTFADNVNIELQLSDIQSTLKMLCNELENAKKVKASESQVNVQEDLPDIIQKRIASLQQMSYASQIEYKDEVKSILTTIPWFNDNIGHIKRYILPSFFIHF